MDNVNDFSLDHSDGSMAVLATNLEAKFKVRDSLRIEVLEGFSEHLDLSKRVKSISIICNSIIVNYGNSVIYDEMNLSLSRNDLDQVLSPDLLEEMVVKPLSSGEYVGDLLRESVKLLFAASAYLPLEIYGKVFTLDLMLTLLSISEFASSDINSNREVWSSSISTIRNIICHVNINHEVLNRLINCFFNIVDENSIQLCNSIVVKILFNKTKESNNSCNLIQSNLGLTLKLSKRITEFLVSVLDRTEETPILTTACSCLVSICEHSFGVDLFLESGGLKRIIDLSLIVVNKYEAMMALENKFKKVDTSPKLSSTSPNTFVNQAFHEVAFSSLSVISKVAFTSNHRQILTLIENEVPETLVKLLNCPVTNSKVKARSCNTLGNLGCETDSEVQAIIDADALTSLIDTFQNDLDHNVKVESAYAICACLSKSNRKQIGYIISCNSKTNHLGDGTCMLLISNMLDFIIKCDPTNESSIKLCRVVLNGLENILKVGEHETKVYNLTENPYIKMFKESQGDVKLSRVCFYPEYNIAKKATMILTEYFDGKRSWNMERVH